MPQTLCRLSRLFACLLALPAVASAQEVGPAHGSLVIVGGGMRDPTIAERFLSLAGGADASIVIIPTAGAATEYDSSTAMARRFRALGASNLSVLHTRDRSVADSEEFAVPIREAGGVWFSGGRQWRLLDRGGVIGGSSAGATIQGSYLVRGDTRTNTIMMGDHEDGFGFLKHTAIDQHVLRRNRDGPRGLDRVLRRRWPER